MRQLNCPYCGMVFRSGKARYRHCTAEHFEQLRLSDLLLSCLSRDLHTGHIYEDLHIGLSSMWQLIAEGEPGDGCGSPVPYHSYHDGTRVWSRHQCGRRECPICADRRYVVDCADDITRTVMGWLMRIIAERGLYDDQGRSLKVYHYIYSREENDNDLRRARKGCSKLLQRAGMAAGYSIVHPYRGRHGRQDTPMECRKAMDRSRLSIHIHGVAVGYWSDRPEGEQAYFRSDAIADLRSWASNPDGPIALRRMLLSHLQYDLGHAGWYGRGQTVTTWGDRESWDHLIPDRPHIYLRHPTMVGDDGDPVWERRVTPDEQDWDAMQDVVSAIVGMDSRYLEDPDLIVTEMPHAGEVPEGYMYPWYSLDEVEAEEWHFNWWTWRHTISEIISSQLHHT